MSKKKNYGMQNIHTDVNEGEGLFCHIDLVQKTHKGKRFFKQIQVD